MVTLSNPSAYAGMLPHTRYFLENASKIAEKRGWDEASSVEFLTLLGCHFVTATALKSAMNRRERRETESFISLLGVLKSHAEGAIALHGRDVADMRAQAATLTKTAVDEGRAGPGWSIQ